MDFSIGQFLKLDGAYYIVTGLTESGRPNKLDRVNKYGISIGDRPLINKSPDGWDVSWEEATPLDPKHAKYEKIIAKMHQLDRKFQNRDMVKKNLTSKSVWSIIDDILAQQYHAGTLDHD
jgi:hypothetical protein